MLNTLWANLLNPKDPLINIRQKSWDRFEEVGLPQGKNESFQYVTKKFSFPPLAERKEVNEVRIAHLLFADGFFVQSTVPAPLVCLSFDQAIRYWHTDRALFAPPSLRELWLSRQHR